MITQVDIKTGKVTQRELTEAEIAALPKITQEDLDAQAREAFKASREEAVKNIKVEVDGMLFDGDETSQTRMSRAVQLMNDTETTLWVLANNQPIQVTKAQLSEALRISAEEQTRLWIME